jgi:hypothetical protein
MQHSKRSPAVNGPCTGRANCCCADSRQAHKPSSKVWVTDDQQEELLAELFSLAPDTGKGSASTLPRAVIVGGVTEAQLHRLMGGCKKAGMPQALWAVLTPTSEQWTLEALLRELAAERAAMQRRRR